jgi:predicted metal-dependent hydrolase
LAQKHSVTGVPAVLHGHPEAIVIYRNLPAVLPPAAMVVREEGADDSELRAALALHIDQVMREQAPAGLEGRRSPREAGTERPLSGARSRSGADPRHLRDHQAASRLRMSHLIRLGDIEVELTRKPVKHAHLSVHPPNGRVTLVTPLGTRAEVARTFAVTKLGWIRAQQEKLREQAREEPRKFIGRENHYVWGRRYLLSVRYEQAKPSVSIDHRRITLTVRPGADAARRAEVMHEWHKSLLHEAVPVLIDMWERRLGVRVNGYFLQRMKTKWGSCNRRAAHIRLNTELVRKPRDLLEYVIVHEMLHLVERTHSERFVGL